MPAVATHAGFFLKYRIAYRIFRRNTSKRMANEITPLEESAWHVRLIPVSPRPFRRARFAAPVSPRTIRVSSGYQEVMVHSSRSGANVSVASRSQQLPGGISWSYKRTLSCGKIDSQSARLATSYPSELDFLQSGLSAPPEVGMFPPCAKRPSGLLEQPR